MQLEAVGRISVGDFGLQVGRQVDDVNRAEGTFLGTDTASDAKALGNEGDLGLGRDLDTKLSGTDDRARLLTFLATFLHELALRSTRRTQTQQFLTFGLHCNRGIFM